MRRVLFFLFCAIGLTPIHAYAATIQKITPAKNLVTINEGSDNGILKKSKICFYEKTTKIGCGSVKSVKPKTTTIRVKSPKTLAKLKVGMEARLEAAGMSSPVVSDAAPPNPDAAPTFVMEGFFAFPLVSPIGYSNLVYETPLGKPVSSMWTADSRVKSLGGGIDVGFGIGSMTLALGARLRAFTPKRIASDYDDKDADEESYFEQYAETIATGSSFGAFLDFHYLNYRWGITSLSIGNGLDFDSSTVKLTMEQRDENNPDDNNIMYQATSQLTALSLRTNLMLNFTFGFLTIKFGSTIFVPLSETQKFKLEVSEDPFITNLQELTDEEDAKKALEHKAQVAAELILGAQINF